ncbi:hypothetical protein [Pseudorhodoferax sp. Leaf267]|uniref:hypothetical protein n=1 Tax=Pseudorhodoferax sp. Leaf267 TaxID=1736316 RepID=UPI0012E2F26C|nr:hypothetical protein [Pseudorhodoferax sp. Leaf267]
MQRGIVIAVAAGAGRLVLEIEGGRCAILQFFRGARVRAGDVLAGRLFNVGGARLQHLDGQAVVCAMLGFRSRAAALRMLRNG